MSDRCDWGGIIRKLWPSETHRFRDHLLRLNKESRRSRFAHQVSDRFIIDYAERMTEAGSITYAYIEDGEVRAVAELRKLADQWGKDAEAAFSVEDAYQNRGVGSELMGYVIRAARNRGIMHLYMSCLAENRKMQAIARNHEAHLRFEYGDVVGEIVPTDANYFSVMGEAIEDRLSFMLAVLDISEQKQKRNIA